MRGAVGGIIPRDVVLAWAFGATRVADAFYVAFRIPNLLRDLFAEGALSAAFITVFTDYDTNKSKKETWQLASNVMVFFAVLLSCLTLMGIFFADPLVNLLASGEMILADAWQPAVMAVKAQGISAELIGL